MVRSQAAGHTYTCQAWLGGLCSGGGSFSEAPSVGFWSLRFYTETAIDLPSLNLSLPHPLFVTLVRLSGSFHYFNYCWCCQQAPSEMSALGLLRIFSRVR